VRLFFALRVRHQRALATDLGAVRGEAIWLPSTVELAQAVGLRGDLAGAAELRL
jgi:hypothetical protein